MDLQDDTMPDKSFNSRSRVGSDSSEPSSGRFGRGFNSRSRVGSDKLTNAA